MQGKVSLKGTNNQLESILQKLSLHPGAHLQDSLIYSKQKVEEKSEAKEENKNGSLAIGFKANEEEEEID